MSSGKTMYIINDIYDIIVKQIVYTDVVHPVSYNNHAISGKQRPLLLAIVMFN